MKNYDSFARTSVGFSHISSQKPCQDYSATFENDAASVIVVSDGHGSNNFTRSHLGSQFACEVAVEAVKEFLPNLNLSSELSPDEIISLCRDILSGWNARVMEDAANNPFTEEEVEKVAEKYRQCYLNGQNTEHAYGCTLILVIITQDFWLAIRNGDGQCVAVDRNGTFTTPIPWNDRCEFNVTTSLCERDALDNFRYFYSTELPAAVFAGSDGVDDSYPSIEELYHLYRNLCLDVLDDGPDATAEHVGQLLPEISKRGSTDDVSIAALLDLSMLEQARASMENALEQHQLQLVEARKKQRMRILARDIKVAEKKKAKAMEQQKEVLRKLQACKDSRSNFWEQINIFLRKADACSESMKSLSTEAKQFADIINGADSEIARLTDELAALEGEITNASVSGSPADGAATKIEGLSDGNQAVADRPETVITP